MAEVKNDFDVEQWVEKEKELYKSLISKAKVQEHNQQSIQIFGQRYKYVDGYYVGQKSPVSLLYTIIKEDQIQNEWMEAVDVYTKHKNHEIIQQIEYRENGKYEHASRHARRPITGLHFDDQGNLLKPVSMYGPFLAPEEAIEKIQNDIMYLEAEQDKLRATKSRIIGYSQQPNDEKSFLSKDTLMPIEVPEQYRKVFNAAKKFNSITKE